MILIIKLVRITDQSHQDPRGHNALSFLHFFSLGDLVFNTLDLLDIFCEQLSRQLEMVEQLINP
jgi:hypothetical protein